MNPYLYLSQLVDEDHLFTDVEKTHFFVENLESLKGCFGEVKLIREGYIVDFLETKVYFLRVEPGLVYGGAHVFHGIVNEGFYCVDILGEVIVALVVVLPYEFLAGWFFSEP
jgi:hypothetical protein